MKKPPQYALTVTVDGQVVEAAKPLDDPFVTTTVVIDPRDLRAAVEENRNLVVVVHVSGSRAAIRHVMGPMDLTPNEKQPVHIEGAEMRAEA